MKANWSVVIIYENVPTREEAVRFSDSLVKRFWAEYEFDFGWWSVDELAKAAHAASEKACSADLIVFALQPEGSMPGPVVSWVESWIHRRSEREGALAGLLDPAAGPTGITTEKYLYLRSVAHRAGMDYLLQVPEHIAKGIPDSLDSYAERASQKTDVLDEIMKR